MPKSNRKSPIKICRDRLNKETCYHNYWYGKCDNSCCQTCKILPRYEECVM